MINSFSDSDSDSDLEVVFEDTEKPKPKQLLPSANSGVPPRQPLLAQQASRKRPLLLPSASSGVPPRKPILAQQASRKRPLLLRKKLAAMNRIIVTKMSQSFDGGESTPKDPLSAVRTTTNPSVQNAPKDPLAVNSTTTTTNPSVQNKPKPKGYSHLFNKNKPSPIRRQFEVEAAKKSSDDNHKRQAISCLYSNIIILIYYIILLKYYIKIASRSILFLIPSVFK